MTDNLTILEGDVRQTLPALPESSVHVAITSPPYWALRSYLPAGHELKSLELGSEPTPQLFIENLVGVFSHVHRALRDDGALFVNLGDSYDGGEKVGIPERFALAMQEWGWYWRDTIIWAKPAPMPSSVNGWRWERCRVKVEASAREFKGHEKLQGARAENSKDFASSAAWADCPGCPKCKDAGGYVLRKGSWRTTNAHEYIFMFTKTDSDFCDAIAVREPAETATLDRNKYTRVLDDPDEQFAVAHDHEFTGATRNPRSVWRIASGGSSLKHYAMFPPELPRRCIEAATPAHGVCVKCGAPWARVVEMNRTPRGDSFGKKDVGDKDHGQAGTPYMEADAETLGWRPTCKCGTELRVPATVLDCFGGSGTTAEVAIGMGRRAILCELNPEYVKIIRQRLNGAFPLLVGGAA